MSDDFNFDGKPSRPQGAPMQMWDVLSVLVLVLTACVAAYFVFVYLNPTSNFNLLPLGGRGFSDAGGTRLLAGRSPHGAGGAGKAFLSIPPRATDFD